MEVIPPIYDDIEPKTIDDLKYFFNDDFALVKNNDKYFFVDKNNKSLGDLKFDWAKPFNDEYAAVKKDDKWGFINTKGELVVPTQYKSVRDVTFLRIKVDDNQFDMRLAPVQNQNDKWGFISINKFGFRDAKSYKFDDAYSFNKKANAWVKLNNQYYMVNALGKTVSDKYDEIEAPNSLTQVIKAGKYGFVNEYGKVVIPVIYDNAVGYPYLKKNVEVKLNNKWYIVDKKGKIIREQKKPYIKIFKR